MAYQSSEKLNLQYFWSYNLSPMSYICGSDINPVRYLLHNIFEAEEKFHQINQQINQLIDQLINQSISQSYENRNTLLYF